MEEIKQEDKFSKEVILQVFQGIRPEGMDKEVFKLIRKEINKQNKIRLKGQLIHVSNMVMRKNEKGEEQWGVLGKGITRYREKEEIEKSNKRLKIKES
jgi:hypothetical protein